MNNKRTFFIALIFLMTIIACAIPGLPAASAPTPTADTGILSTMVAQTVSAAIVLTEQATATATLPPTATATATPRISLYGTSLLLRDDQTYVFTDRQAGIELIIPAGWLPIRVSEQEYLSAFASDAAKDPAILSQLNFIQSLDPAWFRLDAIDIQPGHVFNGGITDINVIFQENDPRSLEEVAEVEKGNLKPFTNYEFLSSEYQLAANGMNTLMIEERWESVAGPTYYRGVFFKTPSGLVVLDFYSPIDFKDTVLPDFEKVVNSLVLLNP